MSFAFPQQYDNAWYEAALKLETDRVHCIGDANLVDGRRVSRRKESGSVSGSDLYTSLPGVVCFCLAMRLCRVSSMRGLNDDDGIDVLASDKLDLE